MQDKGKKLFLAKEWFLSAQSDEQAVEIIIKDKDWPPNPVCFFSQQIGEKVLKGFLTFYNVRFPKVHLLDVLVDLCKIIDADFAQIEDEAMWLSDFYTNTRYPGDMIFFSVKEAKEAFQKAISIKNFVMNKIFQNKNMLCPNCANEQLKEVVFNNTAVDYCLKCLGLWFDDDELRQAKDEKDRDLNWLDIDLWSDEKKFQLGKGRKVCPKDSVPLYEVSYGDSDIKVDVCEQCRGIWLDRGEFKKVIDYLKNKGQNDALNNYFANFIAQGIEVFTGPETLKEELADFVSILKVLNYKFMVQYPYLANLIILLPK